MGANDQPLQWLHRLRDIPTARAQPSLDAALLALVLASCIGEPEDASMDLALAVMEDAPIALTSVSMMTSASLAAASSSQSRLIYLCTTPFPITCIASDRLYAPISLILKSSSFDREA